MEETSNTAKNSELREKLNQLQTKQKERRNDLVREAKRFLAGRQNQETIGSDSRLPYKEN